MPLYAHVGELAYPPDLGSGFCEFESHLGYYDKSREVE